jgi:hypothetical protein
MTCKCNCGLYSSGWQSRWFILDDGVLSYFKSYEDVSQGCKGSISLNVCEIIVSSSDSTRLDLNVSNEQHLYLKANSEKERQQWLVSLGSAKAGLANRSRRQRVASSTSSNVSFEPNQALTTETKTWTEDNSLKAKKSELRLYCDLLMQQVHTVKSSVVRQQTAVDEQQLENGSSLLVATCDTFIKTLDDLMEMANANLPGGEQFPSAGILRRYSELHNGSASRRVILTISKTK